MKHYFLLLIFLTLFACNKDNAPIKKISQEEFTLNTAQAYKISQLPLRCMEIEFPNKPSETLENEQQIASPQTLHPAFFGCFDWHSSVHGHWVLVKLLNDFPQLKNRNIIIQQLLKHLSKENIQQELNYFNRKQEYSFERTYGWAWLLKLAQELHLSKLKECKIMEQNLKPLTDLIAKRFTEFLPKLTEPVRAGTHNNTAFAMVLAYDYAKEMQHETLKKVIETQAKIFFAEDADCPINWEPSGTDFLSPCLEEVDLMRRILPEKKFLIWAHQFLPQMEYNFFDLKTAKVSDKNDGHLVHLDGLNFSRAWIFYGLASQYPKQYKHLIPLADKHLAQSLPNITKGNYEGEHWLATFALYTLNARKNIDE